MGYLDNKKKYMTNTSLTNSVQNSFSSIVIFLVNKLKYPISYKDD